MSTLTCANPACGRPFRPTVQQAFLAAHYPHHRRYCDRDCRVAHQRKPRPTLACAGCGAAFTANQQQADKQRQRGVQRAFCPSCVVARDRRGPQGWDGPVFGNVGKAGPIDHDDHGEPDRGRDAPPDRRPGDAAPMFGGLDPLRDAG